MKTVNAKIFALKYKLIKKLTDSLNKDKELIKNGAEITYKNYCKIQLVECSRSSYSKQDQKKLDEYAKRNSINKQITYYKRIEIDGMPIELDKTINDIISIINSTSNTNNKIIKQ